MHAAFRTIGILLNHLKGGRRVGLCMSWRDNIDYPGVIAVAVAKRGQCYGI
jgi:hypothetical protein